MLLHLTTQATDNVFRLSIACLKLLQLLTNIAAQRPIHMPSSYWPPLIA